MVKLLQSASMQVKTDLSALNHILAWFDSLLPVEAPQRVKLQCQLALAEGFTNAVRHAHRGKPVDTPIEIEVRLFDQHLEFRIWDYGPPSNLGQILSSLSQDMDQDAEGGRGLKLIKKVADALSYERIDDQRNCLSVAKNYTH